MNYFLFPPFRQNDQAVESERARQAGGGIQPEGGQRHHQGSQLYQGPAVRQSYSVMCRYKDEGVVWGFS
jgi:hypothetical protein